jgi:hypothetical protein
MQINAVSFTGFMTLKDVQLVDEDEVYIFRFFLNSC